ncbi:MAG: hypothetical protein LBD37_08665 [Treponema sp.]|nr:hypothetical protein [Treponema sp.]
MAALGLGLWLGWLLRRPGLRRWLRRRSILGLGLGGLSLLWRCPGLRRHLLRQRSILGLGLGGLLG